MSYWLQMLFMFLLFVKQETELTIAMRKFVYQKDMSEYCRRRVMPSVFLGRQVVAAYSQILHFSRLELPYSCFVSIRTESGSNIILVIQLMSDKNLQAACHESKNQLLVYEIGETFGGYWGALPDNVMEFDAAAEPANDQFQYTLKTTQSTTTPTTEKSTTRPQTMPITTKAEDGEDATRDQQEYFTLEVPIVNVSGRLEPGRLPVDTIFDPDDTFDAVYDVTPWSDMTYETKVLPLVQFSLENKEVDVQRTGDELSISPRYQGDFDHILTPDSRLLFPLLGPSTKGKLRQKYKFNANRQLHFKKNKLGLAGKEALFHRKSAASYPRPPLYTTPYDFLKPPAPKETERISWEVIDAILKNLSKTKDDVSTTKVDSNLENLLFGLAKIGHNDSVPISSWKPRPLSSTSRPVSTKYRTDSITWRQPTATYRTNYLDEIDVPSKVENLSQEANKLSNTLKAMNNNDSMINSHDRTVALLPLALDVDGVILNVTNKNNGTIINSIMNHPAVVATEVSGSTTSTTPKIMKPLTLLDHESWENMVHAASLMAVMLNQTVTQPDHRKEPLNTTYDAKISKAGRKKRYIHAIPIMHAKPHRLNIETEASSSPGHVDKISDTQDFHRLIELQDDEIHDRVALRYLRQYVGPVVFNICDFDETATRHVYLFNSSRLILSLTNFTLDRMTVVMTPARTLLTSDAHCADAHLECQVSGARVCIDSLSACDGVPNCGSYDIYDEDRLTCGGAVGFQHNVCLAAITFLAVLLTILYTIHYWLKRCVPKVSDAFFIYTDAAENVLYLGTIMRSPHDTDDGKYFYRDDAIHNYMEYTDVRTNKNHVASLITRFYRFITCKYKKRESHIEIIEQDLDNLHSDVNKRISSLAELELGKSGLSLVVDAAVQTGSSLQINVPKRMIRSENISISDSDTDTDDILVDYEANRRSRDNRSILENLEMLSNQPSHELSILKFFQRARSVSMQMADVQLPHKDEIAKRKNQSEEKEIQCLEYEAHVNQTSSTTFDNVISISKENDTKKSNHGLVRKQLRFEEDRRIRPENENDSIEEEGTSERPRRSFVYGGVKNVRLEDVDSNTDVEEPSTSTNREFKSYFWGGSKNKTKKTPKKKTQHPLLK